MKSNKRILFWFVLASFLGTGKAFAGMFEVSTAFSYKRSNFAVVDSYSWTRTYRLSAAYHLSQFSGIEAAFEDSTNRTRVVGYQDITTHDREYSLSWIQGIMPTDFFIQPYVKGGIAQLNREISGNYYGVINTSAKIDSITGVLGAGLKIFLMKRIAIRLDAQSLLAGGRIGNWKDNISFTAGGSVYF